MDSHWLRLTEPEDLWTLTGSCHVRSGDLLGVLFCLVFLVFADTFRMTTTIIMVGKWEVIQFTEEPSASWTHGSRVVGRVLGGGGALQNHW